MHPNLPRREYEAAGGVVVDTSLGRVLLLKRPGILGPHGTAELRLPKGHIEPGENPRQAALREAGEETGLCHLVIVAELGQQVVEFDWKQAHVVRTETYFLMLARSGARSRAPESQFERLWLTWPEAKERITFEAEGEWLRRAQSVLDGGLENIADQHSQQPDDDAEMQKQVAVRKEKSPEG
jgi:8-oxo-dGTP pyrophosphatase MutT (NUDIX family)